MIFRRGAGRRLKRLRESEKGLEDVRLKLLTELVGNVSEVDLQVSQWHPELVAVDKEANDNIVHLNRLGKAERLACQSLNSRT